MDPDHEALLHRPVDPDNRILMTKFVRIAGIPMLLEQWSGDAPRRCAHDGGGDGGCTGLLGSIEGIYRWGRLEVRPTSRPK